MKRFWIGVLVFIFGGIPGLVFLSRGHSTWGSIWRGLAVSFAILLAFNLIYFVASAT